MKKRLLSIVTTGVVAATMLFSGSAAAFAAKSAPAPEVTAKVEASMQAGYSFIMCHKTISVSSKISRDYGYTDAYDYAEAGKVTALDVMLAMHKEKYGANFTKDTKDNYFGVSDGQESGYYLNKVFGKETFSLGYYIDDNYAGSSNEIVAEGSKFDLFEYQGTWPDLDYYAYFSTNGKSKTEYTGLKNVEIPIELFSATRDNNGSVLVAAPNADIYIANQNTGERQGEPIAKTDANGKATVKFDKEGTYYLTATRPAEDGYITMPWCKVIVKGKTQTITAKSLKRAYSKNKTFKLNAKAQGKLTYASQNKKVAVIDSKGKVTIKGTGKTIITIKAAETGVYHAASKKITLTVTPKKVSGVAVAAKKKAIAVSWSKDSKASGYQILCATNANFTKGKKTVTVKGGNTTKKTISKLEAKKTYYIKARAYKTVDGKKIYGDYSAKMKMKTR